MRFSILIHVLLAARPSIAGYVLEDDYNPTAFLSMFNAYTGADPTDGFVKYVDIQTGISTGLIQQSAQSVLFGVDSTNVITSGGRPSIRLESKKTYNSGLMILDLAHMPGSVCGTWPAFWTVSLDNWPVHGEIDVIEGVNSNNFNTMTLHTDPGCSIDSTGDFSGTVKTANCAVNAPGQSTNAGCGIQANGANTYGDGFNSAGGGVYAIDWTSQTISIYYFARGAIPADITAGAPDPAGWPMPLAQFQGGCDIGSIFQNHSIVFDMTFCGQWAGQAGVWNSDPVCSQKASTCQSYVQNNPADFAESYWQVNSLQVYQVGAADAAPPSAALSSLIPAAPTSSSLPTTFSTSAIYSSADFSPMPSFAASSAISPMASSMANPLLMNAASTPTSNNNVNVALVSHSRTHRSRLGLTLAGNIKTRNTVYQQNAVQA